MSRFRPMDIVVELIELCHERMDEVRQQLVYYRASVYKDETAALISDKIDQLALVAKLLGDELLNEAFADYEVITEAGVAHYIPGECSFSRRVSLLLASLGSHLRRLNQQVASRPASETTEDFADTVKKHRQQLLALCRHGSRQWAFFESL